MGNKRWYWSLLLALLFMTACAAPDHHDAVQKGITAFLEGRPDEAATQFERAKDYEHYEEWKNVIDYTRRALLDTTYETNPFEQEELPNLDFLTSAEHELVSNRFYTYAMHYEGERMRHEANEKLTQSTESVEALRQDEHLLLTLSADELVELFTIDESTTSATGAKASPTTATPTNSRDEAIARMERDVNGNEYVKQIHELLAQLIQTNGSYADYADRLGYYMTTSLVNTYKTHYEAGDLCYACDMENIPGAYTGLTFVRYGDVQPNQIDVHYKTSVMGDGGFMVDDPLVFTYKEENGRWKLHTFR